MEEAFHFHQNHFFFYNLRYNKKLKTGKKFKILCTYNIVRLISSNTNPYLIQINICSQTFDKELKIIDLLILKNESTTL